MRRVCSYGHCQKLLRDESVSAGAQCLNDRLIVMLDSVFAVLHGSLGIGKLAVKKLAAVNHSHQR